MPRYSALNRAWPLTIPCGYDADENPLSAPAKYAICGTCDGRGHHSQRIGAITGREWHEDWDEDSRDLYLSGGMDERCDPCDGTGKMVVLDRDRASPEQIASYDAELEADREEAAIRRSELMAEMGPAYFYG